MKTIFAFSDLHNAVIPEWYRGVMEESDYIFFAGDGLNGLKTCFADKFSVFDKVIAVKGNCDVSTLPEEAIAEVENVKFLIVHGHRFHTPLDLVYRAKELGADCVIYGHTHSFSDETEQGVRLINDGSFSHSFTGDVGYVYMVVDGKNIFANFVKKV